MFLLYLLISPIILAFIVMWSSSLNLELEAPTGRARELLGLVLVIAIVIAIISSVVFTLLKKVGFIKSGVVRFLLTFLLVVMAFTAFNWFYFPHYNNEGYTACEKLGKTKGEAVTLFSAGKEYDLRKVDEKIDGFIKQNGQPTSVQEQSGTKHYEYQYKHSNFRYCALEVNQSGVIETIFVCQGTCL